MSTPIIFIIISQAWLIAGASTHQNFTFQALPWLIAAIITTYLQFQNYKAEKKTLDEQLNMIDNRFKEFIENLSKIEELKK